MVLADFSNAVRTIVDVESFGVVLRRPDPHAQLLTRHRAGTAGHLIPLEQLPSLLYPIIERLMVVSPLRDHREASHPMIVRVLESGAESLLLVPLPDQLGLFWAGRPGTSPLTDEQLAELERLAARLAAAVHEPEPRDLRLSRLARIDAVEQILPVVAQALDVRDVFHRLSEVARSVLPHEAATIQLLDLDPAQTPGFHGTAQIFALDGLPREHVAETFEVKYAHVFNAHFQFSLHDDLLLNPMERDRPAAKAGMRSVLRLPLLFDGRVSGSVEFCSSTVSAYEETDVDVARRIADYITLALGHQRMAEAARRAATLKARSDNLLMLDDLLGTLSGVLDLREVFDRVSASAKKVLRHDAMAVTTVLEQENRIRVHALSGFTDFPPFVDAPLPEPELLTEPWEYRIIDDFAADPRHAQSPTFAAGMRSVLGLPVRVDGRLRFGVNFYSRSVAAFTPDDVLIGKRIANHLALALSHQRLADEARQSAELTARTGNFDLLDESLATVTGLGDLPDVWSNVSTVVQKVLAHDAVVLTAVLPGGTHARVYASTTASGSDPWPDIVVVPPAMIANPEWEDDLVDDLQTRPEQRNLEATKRGFRAALRVPIRLDGKYVAGISFLSFTPSRYTTADVSVARRVAERITFRFARERDAAVMKRADEATARATQLEARVRALTEELDTRTGYRRVIGKSAPWKRVLTQATQVASTDTTVLLLGESGTGKEVIARFVHRASSRRDGPFIALNCAALPENLLEAELFGYERGAFTGATQSKPGQLEQAGGGTLFLDEVGEMNLQVQAKFLRVLQEREFQRLGGTRVLRTDARIVAATNRDLAHAITQGQFREDLFYRLNVFAIGLPLLRDRMDDVLPLSEAFLAEYGRTLGRAPGGISRDARQKLMEYHWPGNVRELRNVLERAAILCDGGLITAEHLAVNVVHAPSVPPATAPGQTPAPVARTPPAPDPAPSNATDLSSVERSMIEQALQAARFNKSKAATSLGITRAQLYGKMRRYGLA
jgi:transcriptional regulator with GAF, ATPase, and Fis domain